MSGIGGIIGSVVGWMGYQVGLREDSASSTGSLHAKVGELRDYLPSILRKPRGPAVVSVSGIGVDTYVTVLDITGRGRLINVIPYIAASSSVAKGIFCKITIDGTEFMFAQGNTTTSLALYYLPTALFPLTNPGTGNRFVRADLTFSANHDVPVPINYEFKQSLKVETKKYNTNTYTVGTDVIYELE